jgi:hypothetical protein
MLSLGMLLAGCSREPEATEQSAGTTEGATVAPAEPAIAAAPPAAVGSPPSTASAPRMGGALVATGDYAVEVAASAEGAIDAAVTTATGAAVANSEIAALEVTAQGEGTARHTITLGWDAPRGMFRGMAKAGARLASGPLDVSCSAGGKVHKGRLDLAVVLPRPRFGGRMMVVGSHSAEVVPKVDGEIDVHLQNAAGAAVTADAGLELGLQVSGKAGAMHAVGLRWDGARSCFKGKLEGGAELAAGPIELTAKAGELNALGRVEAVALIAPPSIGGSVIAAGDFSVEVAPRAEGQIEAIVRNSAGVAVEGGVELSARVQAGGELRPVTLTWDPALLRFRGKLEGDFKLEGGPLEISLIADGKLRAGSIMAAVVLPAAKLDADASLAANAKLDVKAKAKAKAELAAKLKAEAAAAQKAQAQAKAKLAPVKAEASGSAKLNIKVPEPSVKTDAKASGQARSGAAASGSAKAGAKLGGSLSTGIKLGGN